MSDLAKRIRDSLDRYGRFQLVASDLPEFNRILDQSGGQERKLKWLENVWEAHCEAMLRLERLRELWQSGAISIILDSEDVDGKEIRKLLNIEET